MRELSLFSGAGGGLLGTKLLGWTHCGYVEYDDFCQRIIKQRIADGILKEAPIFGDIRAFISEGYADAYQGLVDVVTAGFPCQPFSLAGKRSGGDDSRNMWPQTIDVICRVRPRFALLENVPGLLAHEYSSEIFRDLAESGYSARWRILSAAECGAPHRRDRLWIFAYFYRNPVWTEQKSDRRGSDTAKLEYNGENGHVANTKNTGLERQRMSKRVQQKRTSTSCTSWWQTEPDVGRVADGISSRVDRIKAIGNGQVPAVVRAAWELLR